jgi:hypothetical protein
MNVWRSVGIPARVNSRPRSGERSRGDDTGTPQGRHPTARTFLLDDPTDLGLKAHVKHAVGLIQNQVPGHAHTQKKKS